LVWVNGKASWLLCEQCCSGYCGCDSRSSNPSSREHGASNLRLRGLLLEHRQAGDLELDIIHSGDRNYINRDSSPTFIRPVDGVHELDDRHERDDGPGEAGAAAATSEVDALSNAVSGGDSPVILQTGLKLEHRQTLGEEDDSNGDSHWPWGCRLGTSCRGVQSLPTYNEFFAYLYATRRVLLSFLYIKTLICLQLALLSVLSLVIVFLGVISPQIHASLYMEALFLVVALQRSPLP
jgi:hypothetical protein